MEAGKSSPMRTQGTGPSPTVKEKVNPRRLTRGSQEPTVVITTEAGSWCFRKNKVPSIPMKREQKPVENISKDRLPTMFSIIVPRVVPYNVHLSSFIKILIFTQNLYQANQNCSLELVEADVCLLEYQYCKEN